MGEVRKQIYIAVKILSLVCMSIALFNFNRLFRARNNFEQSFFMSFLKKYSYLTYLTGTLTFFLEFFSFFIERTKFYKNCLPVLFSINFAVTVLYWFLYLKNPLLVHSERELLPENKASLVINLFKHGLPFMLCLMEMIAVKNINFEIFQFLLVFLYINFYFAWMFFCKAFTYRLPYGFLEKKSFLGNFIFFQLVAFSLCVFLWVFYFLKKKIKEKFFRKNQISQQI